MTDEVDKHRNKTFKLDEQVICNPLLSMVYHFKLNFLSSNFILIIIVQIGKVFGPEFLLKLYLAGAVVGSIFYLVHHAFMAPSSKVPK